MNKLELIERCWQELGYPSSADARPDWRRQIIDDGLAEGQDEISRICPFMFSMIRESSLSLVAGTSEYALDDWCRYPISFYTLDDSAHKVFLRVPRIADYDGSRNPNLVQWGQGPFELVPIPRTTTPFATQASITESEGDTTIAANGAAATWVGRKVTFNNSSEDYKVSSVSAGVSFTMDKALRARLTGVGTTGTGAGLTAASVQVSPVGAFQIKVLGGVPETYTLYYRGVWIPRRMIADTDRPEIPDAYHHLLWKRALKNCVALNENNNAWQRVSADYERELEILKQSEQDMQDSDETPVIESTLDSHARPRGRMDTDYRCNRW